MGKQRDNIARRINMQTYYPDGMQRPPEEAVKCRWCGRIVPASAARCPGCGIDLTNGAQAEFNARERRSNRLVIALLFLAGAAVCAVAVYLLFRFRPMDYMYNPR